MAENIRLETTVSMNTRPLERNITTAQAKLKAMNKSLRDQSKHFKQAGEDADGLASREQALTEAMDEQNVMISEKEKALAKVKSEIKDTTAMTNKETKAMERARAEVSKAKYELRAYETDMRKTRASIIKFSNSTADMSKEMDSLSIKSAKVSSEYRKQGDEVGALKTEYEGLSEQVELHQQTIDKEKASLEQIGKTIGNTSKEYNEQQAVITKLNNEHIKLIAQQEKSKISMDKASIAQISLNNSTKDISSSISDVQINSARVSSEFRKQGDEVNALKAEYDALDEQIKLHNKQLEQEHETLEKIGNATNKTGEEYNKQQAHITKLNNEHIKLLKTYDKISVSLTKAREESDLYNRGMIRTYLAGTRLNKTIELGERGWKTFTNTMHNASATINRLGSTFRNIGLVIGGMALGGLIQNLSTLVPLGGSLISVFAGLGGALTAVGGGAIGMYGAFGIAGLAVKSFAGQAQTALQMVEDGEMAATAELDRYKNALSGLQTQWKGVVQGNQAAIFNTMANGIDIARFALTKLNPFMTKTANQISKFSGRMHKWVTESSNASKAFSMLNKIGPPIFQNILNAVFKVTDGLTHMLTQFAPLFTWTAAGLEKIANEFNKWANSASTDKGIASFIEYTKRNLPVAGAIFWNTFSGMVSLFQAFAGHSEVVMRGMAGVTQSFKDWAANLSSTEGFKNFIAYLEENGPKVWEVLKNIGSAVVGVIRGLAPIGALMLDMLVPLTEFFAQIAKYPAFGAFIGILAAFVGIVMQFAPIVIMIAQLVSALGGLAGIAAVLSSPITWIIAGLVALGAALVIAYKKSETFRNIVNRAFEGVVIAFQFLWDGIKFIGLEIGKLMGSMITSVVDFAKSTINTLKSFWDQNGAMIIQAIRNILVVVGAYLGMIWTVAQPILMAFGQAFLAFWNFIKLQFENIWNMIKGIFSGVLNVILGLVKIFGGVFTGNWSAIWSGLGQVVMGLIGIILAPIKFLFGTIRNTLGLFGSIIKAVWFGIWGALKGIVVSVLTGILASVKWILNGLKTFFSWIWTGIKNIVVSSVNGISNVVRVVFNAVVGFIKWIWGGVSTFFSSLWNGIKNIVMSAVNGTGSGIRNVFTATVGFIKWIWGGVKSFFVWVWNGIKNGTVSALRGIGNVIRSIFTGVVNFIKWIWNGIATFFNWYWNSKIGGIFRWGLQAINVVVRTMFAAISKFIKWIWNGIASFFKWVWNGIKNTVVDFVQRIWNSIKYYWNIVSTFTRAVFNAVKRFLLAVWSVIRDRISGYVKAVWNSIKYYWDILSSFTRRIFNSVKNFLVSIWNTIRNAIVSRVRALWNSMKGIWNALSNFTRRHFNNLSAFLHNIWTKIKNGITSRVRSLWNSMKAIWNSLSKFTRTLFSNLSAFLHNIWTKVKNGVTSRAKALWTGVSGTWGNLSKGTRRTMNSVGSYMTDKWNGIKNSVTGIATKLWSSVKGTFTSMKDGLSGLADKIGGVINGMVKGIKKGLNSLIKGVNWVADKLGVDEKIPELSTGTANASAAPTSGIGMGAGVSNGAISSGGFATVNDRGPGNGTGSTGHQEVIQRANGQMFAPKGKDVTVPLGKGDIVHSGKAVQRAQKAGVLPKFSTGTNKKKKYDLLKDMKKNKNKGHHTDAINGSWGVGAGGVLDDLKRVTGAGAKVGAKKATKKAADTTKKGKEVVDTGKKVAEAGAKSAAKIGGDLLEYVGNPGKLVSAMLKKFGVDFGKVKGQIPKDMMWDPMWKGLKGGVKSLFDGWLTEADGAGDGGYIDLSKGINYGFGSNVPGYPFGRHDGLDINYPSGSKLYSTLAGTANGITPDGSGFGNHMWINNGKGMEAIYGHMSKLAWKGKKKVKPGTYLGKSGGALSDPGHGKSTGAHLHYEMRRNGKPFDPTKWLKENNGGGGSKSASKWKSDIKKAAKATGVSLSGGKLNDIVKLIATESNGNSKVKQQVQDVNSGSNAARGLLQYTPGTFKGYATKNGKNILNGMHQLKAFFNNSNWSRDLAAWKSRMARGSTGWGPTGGRRGYATGTNFARSGVANVFEEGGEIMNLRGGEQIIPNDVSIAAIKQMMNSNIFDKTQSAVYSAISRYADELREKQQEATREQQELSRLRRDNTDIKEQNGLLKQLIGKMDALLNSNQNIEASNQEIRDKQYFPGSREITKMNNENMRLNAATQYMR